MATLQLNTERTSSVGRVKVTAKCISCADQWVFFCDWDEVNLCGRAEADAHQCSAERNR